MADDTFLIIELAAFLMAAYLVAFNYILILTHKRHKRICYVYAKRH